jgi:putative DNA primase/helicase
VLASFESYSRIMGGILRDAGVNGFMGNRAQLAEASDDDADDVLQQLIELWWEELGAQPLFLTPTNNPKDPSIAALALANNVELSVGKKPNSDGDMVYPNKPLAKWLSRYKDNVFDLEGGQSVVLTAAPRSNKGTRWQLAPCGAAPVANVEAAA